jgi:hypothetical protein
MKAESSYGILAREPASDDHLAQLSEELATRGFAVIEKVLTESEVANYNQLLDEVYQVQCDEIAKFGHLREINDEDIVRLPLAYNPEFIKMATTPAVIGLAKREMGDSLVLLMQNGVINRPDRLQFQTSWHRDLNYQHWVCSKMICMSALFCLEDFNPETGGTHFLPASHKFENFPSQNLADKVAVAPLAKKGSVIVFNAMTFHRAGVNTSSGVRRAVNHVIGVPILGQQIDVPSMLKQAPEDPWIANYLGFRWNAAPSVSDWRQRKFAAATKASN